MIKKIAYENKVAIQNDEEIVRKNKVTDADLNEIKEVVNNNADEITGLKQQTEQAVEEINTDIENIKQEQTEQNTKIQENATDISDLDTNKASKAELQEATIALQAELLATRKDLQAGTLEGQAEGESLYLQDSSDARFRKFEVGGNSKQKKREGYNLYNVKNELEFANGISVDEEDWITCSYDNTDGEKTKFLNFYTKNLDIETNTNYAIIIEVKNVAGTGTLFAVSHEADGQFLGDPTYDFTNLSNNSIKKTIQKTKETFESNVRRGLRTYLRFAKGESGSITFRISVLKDTSITENSFKYEQYGAMPSLEFPSETEAVGQDVNLFDKDNVEFYNNNSSNFSCTTNAGPTRVRTSSFEFAGEGPYTLSGLIGKTRLLGVRAYGENENIISEGATLNENTFTLTEEVKYIHLLFKNSDDSELNREEVRNMPIKIEKGKQASAYSAYGCGSANITVCNKNVCDNIFEQGVINVSNGKNGPWNNTKYIRTKNYIKIKPNAQFTMTNPIRNRGRKTRFYDKDKNYLGYTAKKDSLLAINDDATLKRVSTMPDNAYYLRFELDFDDAQIGQDVIDGKYKYQLEEGNTATDIVEHEEQTFTIDVQQETLEGDYFDLDNEEEVHTWGKHEITGNEADLQGIGWFKSNTSRTDAYGITNERIGLPVLTENTSKCTHAKYTNNVNAVNTTKYVSSNEKFYLCFPLGVAETLEEFKTLMQEQVDSGTPVTIYYKLAEPKKIPFNSAQKAVAKQIRETLHSYKDGTHVYSVDEISPIFNARYTKDLNAVINNLSQEAIGGN